MRELVLTDDVVLVNFIETLLKDAGISVQVNDRYLNALYSGIGLMPQRVMVREEDWSSAARLLEEAELGQWIVKRGA